MFNELNFIQEFKEYVKKLDIKTAFEVGCYSVELIDVLEELGITCKGMSLETIIPERVIIGDIRTFKTIEKYDLVFSSGVLEHFPLEEIPEIIKKMGYLSNKYVLNLVPNRECNSYMYVKNNLNPPWKSELDFTLEELEDLHKQAGLEIVESGHMGMKWAFAWGSEANKPYLVYVLSKIKESIRQDKNLKKGGRK